MANNISVLDSSGTAKTVKTTETASIHVPHKNIDTITAGSVDVAGALPAGDNNIGNVDIVTLPSDTFVAEAGALGKGVLLQGDDGTDRTNVLVDTDGHVKVDVVTAPTTTVTGTVTANAGTGTFTTSGCVEQAAHDSLNLNANVQQADSDVAAGNALYVRPGTNATFTVVQATHDNLKLNANVQQADSDVATGNALYVQPGTGATFTVSGSVDFTAPTAASAQHVQGTTADGSAASGNPVLVGGVDGSSNAQTLLADTSGHLQIDVLSITAGDNNIGNVDIVTMPADTFVAENGALGKGVLLQGDDGTDRTNVLVDTSGHLQTDVLSISAGDNNIGNVDIVTHPGDTFAADAQAYGKGVLIQGDDGSDRRALLVGTDGHLQVDVLSTTGTATISGSVDVITPVAASAIHVQGAAAEDASASGNPLLVGGRYDSSARTLDDGDAGAIALDADGAVHIADGGNTITIDGTVTADAGTGTFTVSGCAKQATHDSLNCNANAQQNNSDVAANNALYVQAGTGATFKLAAADGTDIGNVDVASMPADTFAADAQAYGKGVLVQGDDGSDRRALLVGTDGHLQVDVLSTTGTATVSGSVDVITPVAASAMHVQGAAAEDASASGNPLLMGGRYDATPRTLDDKDAGAIALDADGAVHIADGGNTITIDGTVTANAGTGTLAVSGSVDIAGAFPAGDNNIGNVDIVTMPADTFAADAQAYGKGVLVQGDDGSDRRALLVGTDGHLQVDVLAAPTITVTGSVATLNAVAASALHVQGTTAHDSSASGNPLQMGGKAESTRPSAVSDGDAVQLWVDTLGRPVMQVGSAEWNYTAAEYTAEQTDTALIAGSAGLRVTVYDILVSTAASARVLFEESDGSTRLFGRLSLADFGGWSFNSAKGVALTAGSGLDITTACCGTSPLCVTVNWAAIPTL